ncbi:MAG TPA: hypothetical protein VG537_08185 [Candidatus Kapabacteria bacterium]|nr:hypothetical protein [Candidatus Kapabacteria bacterium]
MINQENHTVTLTDGNECSSNTFTIPMGIKKADVRPTESITETGGNFPNPLDASTGFKTTIPFITDAGGMATIRIMNEAGETVLTDHEQLLGAGHHFFYITAEKLPAGTYYYTIEFPKGITIVSKSMLVVK